MISNKTLISLTKYVIFMLVGVCLFALVYFGSGLRHAYAFKDKLDKVYDFFLLVGNVHKERAMQALLAFESDIDERNLEIMRESTNRFLKKLGLEKEFYEKIATQRDGYPSDISSEDLLEFFKPLDEYFLNYLGQIRMENVNTELNGLLISIWQAAHDNIRQNQIRELLLRFCDKKRLLSPDELQMLDDLYFDYTQYPTIIKLNSVYPSFATFNYIDIKGVNKVLEERMEPLWKDIQLFYDVIHDTLVEGQTAISYAKLLEICKRIETQNIDIAEFLISTTKSEFNKSIFIMWLYALASFAILIYCVFVLISVKSKEKAILKDMNIKTTYLDKLKLITKRRDMKIDDDKIQELFTKFLDVVNDADLIELKNKNEYSYFMNNISHEIINPLNNIHGYVQLLENSKNINEEDKIQYMQEISKSSQILKKLFENLLRIASIKSGGEEIEMLELDSSELLNTVFQEVTQKARDAKVVFEALKDPRLEGIISIDIKKIRFIMHTLLDNAIKYNKNRGKIFLYIMATEIKEDRVKIKAYIADKGIGYEMEEYRHDNIFDIDDTKVKVYNQKGLNLAITKEYLRQLDSKLEVKTQKGVGSVFSYEIEHKFIFKDQYKDKFQGHKIHIYGEEDLLNNSELPILENTGLPNFIALVKGYLDHLGFEVEFTKEEDKPIYLVFDDELPFEAQRAIHCTDYEPDFVATNKVYLPKAFCVQALINAYEAIMQLQTKEANKLPLKAVVLGNTSIAALLQGVIDEVDIQIQKNTKYDLAFVDTDTMVSEVKNIPQPCKIVALSYEGNTPMDSNVTYSNFIIKSKDDDKKDYSKDVEKILNDFKAQRMISNKKLRDVLLFKKSIASNNIYKNAILAFASNVDLANNVKELEQLLQTHPYKIVLCDYDATGLTLDKYQKLIQDAINEHRCDIVAGVFVPKGMHIYSKFFKELPANLSKSELEVRIKKYLAGMR